MSDYDEMDIQLELKDRLNYAEIIQKTLYALKNATINPKRDDAYMQRVILDAFTDIPDNWYDHEFVQDINNSKQSLEVDIRPSPFGVKIDHKTCKKYNIPITKKITRVNFFMLKKAIINLLDRRDMLVRRKKIEMTTGKNLEISNIEDIEIDDENE